MSKQMSVEYVDKVHVEAKEKRSMDFFYNRSHFWGRLTHLLAIIASLSAPMYLSFIVGIHPGWEKIILGLIGYAGFIGVLWVLEPVMYFPVLGVAGTYLSFLSGNTANLNLPCSIAAQETVGAETGSSKAEVAGVIGMATAILANKVLVILFVLAGTYIVSILPSAILGVFNFVLPAIFAAIFGQFSYRNPLYGGIGLIIAAIVLFSPIPSLIKIGASVAITITIILYMNRTK